MTLSYLIFSLTAALNQESRSDPDHFKPFRNTAMDA
jgi:hypothetical protein